VTAVEDETLPNGWQVGKIGDLFDSWGGHTPSKANAAYWGPGLPWVSSQDVKTPRLTNSRHSVTHLALAETGLRVCPVGSVLVVVRSGILAHTLPVSVTEVPVTINQDLKAFYSAEPYLNEWLALFLRMSAQRLLASSRRDGTTVQSVQYPLLKNTVMPIPRRAEDRKAVIQAVEKILSSQVVIPAHLGAACRMLARSQRAALGAAYRRALELGEEQPLEGLIDEPLRNGYSARPVNSITPFRVLTLTATTSGWFDGSHFKYTAEEFGAESPFWVRDGDILIQRGNTAEYVGVPALYEGPDRAYLFPDLMIRANVRREIGARYVWYMLLSPQLRDVVRRQASGSAGNMPKVNQGILNALQVPVAGDSERIQIVAQLDEIFGIAQRATDHLERSSRLLDRTPHAVLAKAFRGELSTGVEVEAGA